MSAAYIPVKWSASEPALDPLHAAWLKQTPATIAVYPQVSVPPAAATVGAATIKVRAQYSARTVALHLEWTDDKPAKERGVGEFADSAAVQWPVRYGPGVALPYIGMGHDGAPVALWFWRGDGSVETLAAAGFGTLTAQVPDGVKARGIWKDGKWRVVFTRPLAAAGEQRVTLAPAKLGLVPVAFATWNGEAAERNGLKRLSAWQVLRFEKGKPDAAYAKQLGEVAVAGDAERGKRLMSEKGCAGLPQFSRQPGAAAYRAGPRLCRRHPFGRVPARIAHRALECHGAGQGLFRGAGRKEGLAHAAARGIGRGVARCRGVSQDAALRSIRGEHP